MTMGDRVAAMKNGRIQQCALPQGDQPAPESDLVPVRIAAYHSPHTVRMLPSQHKSDLEARPLARLWAHGGGLRLISFASSITACTRTSPLSSAGSLWSAPSTAMRRVGPRAAVTDRRLSSGGTMESAVP
jgi:ABC-type proline/glycine betaine transport system ATPase subunit